MSSNKSVFPFANKQAGWQCYWEKGQLNFGTET